jgi:hypothetical protein
MDERRELERLRYVARVRDLRAQLAGREALMRRQKQARAEAAVEEARRLLAEHEEQAARLAVWVSPETIGGRETSFSAADANLVLSYVAGVRLQLREDLAAIRRAELMRERARTGSDEARAEYRQAVLRKQHVESQRQRTLQTLRHKDVEREEESLADEQVGRWMPVR